MSWPAFRHDCIFWIYLWPLFQPSVAKNFSLTFHFYVPGCLPHVDDLKGQCQEIFSSGYFHGSSSHKSLKITLRSFWSFSKILGDIRKLRKTTSINEKGCKQCHWCQWHRSKYWKNIRLLTPYSDFKEKNYLYVYSTSEGVQTKWLTFFRRKIFSICHWCQRYLWCTLSYE